VERGIDTGSAFEAVTLPTANTTYLAYAVRLRNTALDAQIKVLDFNIFTVSKDNFVYYLLLNPTITGTPTYVAQSNSAVEVWKGAGTQTVSGGTIINSGIGSLQEPIMTGTSNVLRLGHRINGTATVIALAIKPLTNGASAYAYFNRLESI
jgi:hypothetical protein